MKKLFITPTKSRSLKSPMMKISMRTKVVTFNNGAVKLMNLKVGDFILPFLDVDNPEDWYLAVNPNQSAYQLRKASSTNALGTGGNCIINKLIEFVKINPSAKQLIIPISSEFNKEADGYPLLISGIKFI